jgi:hypothetical protein
MRGLSGAGQVGDAQKGPTTGRSPKHDGIGEAPRCFANCKSSRDGHGREPYHFARISYQKVPFSKKAKESGLKDQSPRVQRQKRFRVFVFFRFHGQLLMQWAWCVKDSVEEREPLD